MAWDSSNDGDGPAQLKPSTPNLSELELSCHCCYDILVDPTTLTCGHNFCRHCLALWRESSHKNECPECREKWEGFPKVNIVLRDAIDKLFGKEVQRRKAEIQADPKISRSLLGFQSYGDNLGRSRTSQHKGAGFFFSGVLTALTFVAVSIQSLALSVYHIILTDLNVYAMVMVLVYHWSSGVVDQHDPLISKPVSHWTPEEVVTWLDHLGPWAQHYREPFQQENVNGRLLLMLGDEELLKPPYSIENQAHRRAVLAELDRVKALGVKPPHNLWEYKAANAGKSLFLLYALKDSPRLTLFYLYLFDYSETFLPFLHTCCPAISPIDHSVESSFLNTQHFSTIMFCFLRRPCALLVGAQLAPVGRVSCEVPPASVPADCRVCLGLAGRPLLDISLHHCEHHAAVCAGRLRPVETLDKSQDQFVCNCFFYWALYFSPIINIDLVVQQLMHPETQAL
ncbi:Bifunctional apoptosis regulator RING finger protein 47 [Collichthys lucidus]|uniref:Bifunctional apoptosis regulator RING finger protein 47 n=1 Tax=Collichthys lucidus TaxID=240159 RepID=A0A4U5U343_COLLU|nr:Bifunctional apoptosis regulator RING finger protein 47 [Collichthys lucidus]